MQTFPWPQLALLAAILSASWLVQQVAGHPWGWLLCIVSLVLYGYRHIRNLYALNRWFRGPIEADLPHLDGLWGDVNYRLEKLLRASRGAELTADSHLAGMLEVAGALPEGIVLLGPDRRIGWINRAAEIHLGLSQRRDEGQYLHYLLRDQAIVNWLRGAANLNEGADADRQPLTWSPTATTTLSMQQVSLANGRTLLLSHDITELTRIDQMRRDFVANVSHELRTPMTVIAGFLEAFSDLESPDPAQLKPQIRLMLEQSERMRRLIDDLLVLVQLENELSLEEEPLDMPAMMRELEQAATSLSQGRHTLHRVADTQTWLQGSHQEIYSACMNLVSNAIRYTPEGGVITLRWEAIPGGAVQFMVEDTGEGIEAQHIPRLTERFYRADKGRSRQSGGTGLGLAIVKRVLMRHQARLRIESHVGRGSVFAAVFPPERAIVPPVNTPSERLSESEA